MSEVENPTDTMLLMLAYLCVKDIDGLNDRVEVLDRFELTDAQISLVCGCARQSVRNARQQNKKASLIKSPKKGKK